MTLIDLQQYFPQGDAMHRVEDLSLSDMARGMTASKILQIADSVRERMEAGQTVTNFTIGDFAPAQFKVPSVLKARTTAHLNDDQTNYPPADGLPRLRNAIRNHYKESLGLDYPVDSIVVASGARPTLYSTFRCLVDPGESVLAPSPSWNNKNFAHLVDAKLVTVPTHPEQGFMPTADALRPHMGGARLLVLCSPMNPAGTVLRPEQLRAICEMVLDENRRRELAGKRLCYLVYDQVYRLLNFSDVPHVTPPGLCPEMARYTLIVDAISKCFAATGLRVGWIAAPPFIASALKALMTHVGAWAPRPEQLATADLLERPCDVSAYLETFCGGISARLDRLYEALSELTAQGLPVHAIAPEGAIYLSVKFDLEGRPGFPDDAAVREYLLDEAGCAIVPFSAFGDTHNKGWVRFSVGAVGLDDIDACMPRLGAALRKAVS